MVPLAALELTQAVRNIQISRFTSGVAATLVLYDWFLVFGRELDTIYRSRWTAAKCIFCFIRFITPTGVILGTYLLVYFRPSLSKSRCRDSINFLIFSMITTLFAAHGLFTLRLIALYKERKYVVWFISIFYVATYTATYGLTVVSTIQLHKPETYYSEPLHICVSLGSSTSAAPVWYAPLAFEVFIFSLTAYRAWRDAKVIFGSSSAPFLRLFYRDGIIAFLVMTGVRVWNIWIYLTQPGSSLYMGNLMMWAITTVLTTRVYINLVRFVRRPPQTTAGFTGAEIDFPGETQGTSSGDRSKPEEAIRITGRTQLVRQFPSINGYGDEIAIPEGNTSIPLEAIRHRRRTLEFASPSISPGQVNLNNRSHR